jgi:EmrB/QacA subfamily drug resistance transporter
VATATGVRAPDQITANGVEVRGHRPIRPALFMTVFCLGLFMTLLDITIVNIAIPDLVTDLNTGLETVLWVGSAYSLVYTVLLITAGRLGDIHGPRKLFMLGLTIFTVASLFSGLAQTPGQLIAFRAGQGLGAALLAPQGLAMITSILAPDRRGPAFAATGIIAGLGVLLGPTLGGFVVTHLDWRWIFFLNVPIGIVTLVLAVFYMPDVRPGRPHRLDLVGVVLLTLGLLGVVFGLIEGERYDWGTITGVVTIPLVIGVGVAFLLAFVIRQVRTQQNEPLLPFEIFADRTYTIMTLVLLAMGFAMVGIFLPLTIYYQSVLGLSAVAAGLVIGIQSFAMMVSSGIVGGSRRLNLKWVLFAGLLLFAAGIGYMLVVARPDASRWAFVPGLIAAGIGMGCVWTPLFGLATGNMAPARAGVAAGVLDTLQEFGSVLATAVLGAVLANRLAGTLVDQANQTAAQLPAELRQPFVAGMSLGASGGMEGGAGQAAGSLPGGLPDDVAAQLHAAAQQTFAAGFTDAMKPTMVIPIVVVVLAAVAVLFVRGDRPAGHRDASHRD